MSKLKAFPVLNKKGTAWNVNILEDNGNIVPIGHEEDGFLVIDEFVSRDQALGWIENRSKNLMVVANPSEVNSNDNCG